MKRGLQILVLILTLVGVNAGAEVVTGTGLLRVQVTYASDQQVVVRMIDGRLTAIGRIKLDHGYGTGKMDAFVQPHGRVQAEWGRAEILTGCNQADVAIYQYAGGGEQLVVATTVQTDRCDQ